MIVKIPLMLALAYIKVVSSASFSKVYVQNGHDYPVEYLQYGASSVYNSHFAQLTAADVSSVVPYASNYVPCGTPCVYPDQVASVVPSANIVQYQAPSLPVVVTSTRHESSPYEYSYVVYDEQTGDHKAQRELSDGSLVRGGYTFLQPDGFVREVQYVADDVQGFNAVVRNYLPATVETKKHELAEKPEAVPCQEDNLKVDEAHHTTSEGQESQHEPSHENLVAHNEEHHEATEQGGHDQPHAEHHEAHEDQNGSDSKPNVENQETNEAHAEPHVEPEEHSEAHHKAHAEPHVENNEENREENHETHEAPHVEHHETHAEPQEEIIVIIEEHHASHDEPLETHHEIHIEETHEKHAPEHNEQVQEEHPHAGHESHAESHVVAIHADHEKNYEDHIAVSEHDIGSSNVLIPYNDIIKCIQAAISGVHEHSSPHKAESPLAYIVLNKPC